MLSLLLLLGACGAPPPVIPLQAGAFAPPERTLVWLGFAEADRYVDGAWQRAPKLDYHFTVTQRRYADRFESVKVLHRTHPDYDGSAGPRDQIYYFRLDLEVGAGDRITARIRSTLGDGVGESDRAFREGRLELRPQISALAPFDTYRITQRYDYAAGKLTEQVELLDHDGPREIPWIRNREQASLFGPQRFDAPPTVR